MDFIKAVQLACDGWIIKNPMYRFPIFYLGDEFFIKNSDGLYKWVPDHRAVISKEWFVENENEN